MTYPELMFERYTESARRTIFYARYEATQSCWKTIEPEHLLLGLLRESPIREMFPEVPDAAEINSRLGKGSEAPVFASVDLPLSEASKRILSYGADESKKLGDRHIAPEHLFLGILRESRQFPAARMGDLGIEYGAALERINTQLFPERSEGLTVGLEVLQGHPVQVTFMPESIKGSKFSSYTELARRALFQARIVAGKLGYPRIEPEHLLNGLQVENRELFLILDRNFPPFPPLRRDVDLSSDMPLAESAKAALDFSAAEADRLGHAEITTAHLLAGILAQPCPAAESLTDRGITLDLVRSKLLS